MPSPRTVRTPRPRARARTRSSHAHSNKSSPVQILPHAPDRTVPFRLPHQPRYRPHNVCTFAFSRAGDDSYGVATCRPNTLTEIFPLVYFMPKRCLPECWGADSMLSQRRTSTTTSRSLAELDQEAAPAAKPAEPPPQSPNREVEQLRATLRQVLNVSVYDAAGRVLPVRSVLRGSLATMVRAITERT
jgi:hypothetical protein